jgi:uncharacterized membrane protein YphA (DoxX/SURF4 family)
MEEVRVMSFYCAGAGQEMPAAGYGGSLTVDDRKAESVESRSNAYGVLIRTSQLVRRLLASQYAILGMRWILAVVFLLSSCGKLVDIRRYSIGPVMEFGILPIPLAHLFGAALPFIELICALGLLFGVATRLSSFGIALMSITFFVAKGVILWQGGDVVCGCFGAVVTTLASLTIYMDPPILLMSLAVMLSPRSSRYRVSLESRLSGRCKERVDRIW